MTTKGRHVFLSYPAGTLDEARVAQMLEAKEVTAFAGIAFYPVRHVTHGNPPMVTIHFREVLPVATVA